MPNERENWALVVGINTYPAISGQSDLFGAVADAADFADWALRDEGGAVRPDRMFFWSHPPPVNPSPLLDAFLAAPTQWVDPQAAVGTNRLRTPNLGQAPSLDDIVDTALELAGRADASENSGRLYLFLAGHGVQTNVTAASIENQPCFLAADFRPGRVSHGVIPCEDLRRGLLNHGFEQVVMFLDCCRSVMQLNVATPNLNIELRGAPADPSYCTGRAAEGGRLAYEAPEPNPTRGAFSSVLIEGLRYYREAEDTLTLEGLKKYVKSRIGVIVAPRTQNPQFHSNPDPETFRLLQAPRSGPGIDIRVTCDGVPPGTVLVLRDDKGRERTRFGAVAPPETVRVPAEPAKLYSIDTLNALDGAIKTVAFLHVGPEFTDVRI